jgi:hypothetical protein
MPKLIVAGCSYSDRFFNEKCYGDYLSDRLNLDYIHKAKNCGSNYSIWRTISTMVINKEIDPDDIVLIQYTEITREEFYTALDPNTNHVVREHYGDGWIIRYKLGCEQWNTTRPIQKMLKTYSDYMVSREFESERFIFNDYNFQCLLEKFNINAYFLRLSCYSQISEDGSELQILSDYFKNRVFTERTKYTVHPFCFSDSDPWHLSDMGHRELANDLHTFLSKDNS